MGNSCRRVFAAIDGEKGTSVIESAARVANEEGGVLRIGHVVDMLPADANGANYHALCDAVRERLCEDLADIVAWAEGLERIESVEICVAAGPVKQALARQLIDPWHPDAVVCGASKVSGGGETCRRSRACKPRATRKLIRTARGSVSTYLVRKLNCPVLVVR